MKLLCTKPAKARTAHDKGRRPSRSVRDPERHHYGILAGQVERCRVVRATVLSEKQIDSLTSYEECVQEVRLTSSLEQNSLPCACVGDPPF